MAFSTGFAGNLALVGIASTAAGLTISFTDWAKFMFIPALLLLICLPIILYITIRPKTQKTPNAPAFAKEQLQVMGKLTAIELRLLAVFIGLIILWVAGKALNIDATTVAFLGLSGLLILKVLNWNDIKRRFTNEVQRF